MGLLWFIGALFNDEGCVVKPAPERVVKLRFDLKTVKKKNFFKEPVKCAELEGFQASASFILDIPIHT